MATLLAQASWAQTPDAPTASASGQAPNATSVNEEGVEYLTRGPMHEAFADPYAQDPAPMPVVNQAPPEPINERPPEFKPEGDTVQWIPGYWAWDDERSDYLWISGVWRETPPGQRWIPGYWETLQDGFRWVSGFWMDETVEEVAYLEQPPESLEQGPASPAPSDQHFYVPGQWAYETTEYQWTPGYWAQSQPNWVWVPAQYIWTPRGCVHRSGYWDYDLAYRGVLFTPVYYTQNVYTRPNYSYRPRYTIDTGVSLLVQLFLRPNQRRYYYGDYYGNQYRDNYYPWVNYNQRSRSYDPLFSYYSVANRTRNVNVINWINVRHQYFSVNERFRPPRTVAAQQVFLRQNQQGLSDVDRSVLRLAAVSENLETLVRQNDTGLRFERLDEKAVDRLSEEVRRPMNDFVNRRRDFEREREGDRDGARPGQDPNRGPDRRRPNAGGDREGNPGTQDPANQDDSLPAPKTGTEEPNKRPDVTGRPDAKERPDAETPADAARPNEGRPNEARTNRERFALPPAVRRDMNERRPDTNQPGTQTPRDQRGNDASRDNAAPNVRTPSPNAPPGDESARPGSTPNTDANRPGEARRPEGRPAEMRPEAGRTPGAGTTPGAESDPLRNRRPGNAQTPDANGRGEDFQQRLNELRQNGQARPERGGDWPSVTPRGELNRNIPPRLQRPNQSPGNSAGVTPGNVGPDATPRPTPRPTPGAAPGITRPGNARPGNVTPGNVTPGNLRPGNSGNGNARPGNAGRPGNAAPGAANPAGRGKAAAPKPTPGSGGGGAAPAPGPAGGKKE